MKSTLKRGLKEPETVKEEVHYVPNKSVNGSPINCDQEQLAAMIMVAEKHEPHYREHSAPRLETRTKESDVFAS